MLNANQTDIAKADSVKIPLLKGMNFYDAKRLLNSIGLKTYPENAKNDIILKQDPGYGTVLHHNEVVTVSFDASDSTGNVIPELRGLSFRRALNILHKYKIKAILKGEGIVTRVEVINKGGEKYYILYGA